MEVTNIVNQLNELRDLYKKMGDEYRAAAYSTAAKSMSNYSGNNSMEELRNLDGIGKGIAEKIIEFITTGHIKKLEQLRKDPIIIASIQLSKIMGAGNAAVREWIASGVRSIDDLKRMAALGKVTITSTQQLGIRYYSDLTTKIPREEVKQIGEEICKIAAGVRSISSCEIVGSYRRGTALSGDVDILICGLVESFLSELKAVLKASAIIVSAGKERLTILWKGKLIRQVDILYVDPSSYFAALNYLTGSYEHNNRLRRLAKSKGMRLNQHGLFRNGERIPLNSEADIYKMCGVEYLAPVDR